MPPQRGYKLNVGLKKYANLWAHIINGVTYKIQCFGCHAITLLLFEGGGASWEKILCLEFGFLGSTLKSYNRHVSK